MAKRKIPLKMKLSLIGLLGLVAALLVAYYVSQKRASYQSQAAAPSCAWLARDACTSLRQALREKGELMSAAQYRQCLKDSKETCELKASCLGRGCNPQTGECGPVRELPASVCEDDGH